MKRIFLATVLLGFSVSAQKVVFEKQFGDSIKVIKHEYLAKSSKLAISYESETNHGKSVLAIIDSDGKRQDILKDEFDGFTFSSAENAVCLSKNLSGYPFKFKYFSIEYKSQTDFQKERIYDKGNNHFFTNNFKIDLVNDKDLFTFNVAADDLYLTKKAYTDNVEKRIKIPNPDVVTITDPSNPRNSDFAYQKRLVDDNTFELVSKRREFKDNQNTTTLYRTQYNIEGELVNKYRYQLSIPKGFFAHSNTKSKGENRVFYFGSDLSLYTSLDINEYLIDNVNKDVFIYGIVKDNDSSQPIAFYIARFKDTGVLLWNKFYEVDDKTGFNSDKRSTNLLIRMDEYMDDKTLALVIQGDRSSYKDRYNHFYIIEKQTGDVKDKKSKDVDLESYKGTLTSGKNNSVFTALKFDKNKFASLTTILAASFNKKVEDAINHNAIKKEVFYDAILSRKGIWLLESDNKTYFKVTLFE